MEFLGVGPLELLFILLIALIFLGPNDMVKAGRTLGRTMRKIVMSPTWRNIRQTSDELRQLPTRLMRDASLEEAAEELKALGKDIDATTRGLNREVNRATQGYAAWITPTNPGQPARPAQITDEANEREPVIAPPEAGLENTPAQDDPEDSNTADPS